MDCFDNFAPLTGEVPSFPFFELWSIVSKARILLVGLSEDDIRRIERDLDVLIHDAKAGLASNCLDEHIAWVIKQESWELNYLPAGTTATQENVRQLFDNWPNGEEESDYLMEDDFSDLEALRMVVSAGGAVSLDCEHFYPVQCAAVLALMNVAECLSTMACPEEDLGTHEDGPIAARLVSAANSAIDAALALGFADELAAIAKTAAEVAGDLAETILSRQQQFNVERARNAATARHRYFKPALQFVQTEWVQNREAFKNNKTDFASVYVGRVRNEFLDRKGDPLKVSEKTIREVWLSDSPPASKRAG